VFSILISRCVAFNWILSRQIASVSCLHSVAAAAALSDYSLIVKYIACSCTLQCLYTVRLVHLATNTVISSTLHVQLLAVCISANFEEDVVEKLPAEFECGIYCGWASVDNGSVYKMVMSVGFNPFYNNTKKTMVCDRAVFFQQSSCTAVCSLASVWLLPQVFALHIM